MTSLIESPLEILRSAADSVRALAELPVTLERTLRDTNALIADARTQLAGLGEQAQRMMAQLDRMAEATDRLVDGATAIARVAREAQQQVAAANDQLVATNRALDQIVRLAEPLDRMGKRVTDGLLRVTGRRGGTDEPTR
jgi:ABC-type transporter Mla subunit MlaD